MAMRTRPGGFPVVTVDHRLGLKLLKDSGSITAMRPPPRRPRPGPGPQPPGLVTVTVPGGHGSSCRVSGPGIASLSEIKVIENLYSTCRSRRCKSR